MNLIRKIFGIQKGISSNKFINKFLNDVRNNKVVQMEVYHNERIILQIQNLKQAGFWFDCKEIEKQKYKKGFVLFFFLKNKNIEKNIYFKNFENTKDRLEMFEYKNLDNKRTFFLHFFDENISPKEVESYLKEIIINVYKITNQSSPILFNLRYFPSTAS